MNTTWYRVEFQDDAGAWRIYLTIAIRKNAIATAKALIRYKAKAKADCRVRVVKEVTSLVYGYNDVP